MVNGLILKTQKVYPADGYLLKVDKYGCLQDNCQQWDGVEEVVNYSNKEVGALLVYPNPASQSIVMSSNPSVNTIEVRNLLGQQQNIIVERLNTNDLRLTTENLPSGIYFIKATDTFGNSLIGKFVKE
jgi:hypothetical protein